MIVVENIYKSFPRETGRSSGARTRGAEPTQLDVLDRVSLRVNAGRVVSVLGPSGCGKTTLLRIVAGLATPDGGRVLLDGAAPSAFRPHAGYLTQQNTLLPWLRLGKNVAFPLKLQGVGAAERHERSIELLQRVGLGDRAGAWVDQLSGGMQQRAMLARLMAQTDRVWLLDEPFASLDEQTGMRLQQMLLDLVAQLGTTVLLVTHSIEESVALSDVIHVLGRCPARVAATIEVSLPHPRDRLAPEFVDVMNRTRRHLLEVVTGT